MLAIVSFPGHGLRLPLRGRTLRFSVAAFCIWSFASPARAGLDLDVAPEPPASVANPGGTVRTSWASNFDSPPERVTWAILDPTRTIPLDQQTFHGPEGASGTREWIVPRNLTSGRFWVRVEYWMEGDGLCAVSEVAFLVAEPGAASGPGGPGGEDGGRSVRLSWGRIKEHHRE